MSPTLPYAAARAAPTLEIDSIALPGGTFSLAAGGGEIVQLCGGSPLARLRVLTVAAGHGFGGPGRCRIDGIEIQAVSAAARAALRERAVACVLATDALAPALPLLLGVAEEARLRGAAAPIAMLRAATVLERAGLKPQLLLPPTVLTPAQTRLALVARALACRPRLLVLERPELGLGTKGISRLAALLHWAAAHEDCCIVMASHHPLLAALADRRVEIAPALAHQS